MRRNRVGMAYLHVTPSCQSTQSYTGPGSLYFFSSDASSSDWLCSSSFCNFSIWAERAGWQIHARETVVGRNQFRKQHITVTGNRMQTLTSTQRTQVSADLWRCWVREVEFFCLARDLSKCCSVWWVPNLLFSLFLEDKNAIITKVL